jgi:hypothetical protein
VNTEDLDPRHDGGVRRALLAREKGSLRTFPAESGDDIGGLLERARKGT